MCIRAWNFSQYLYFYDVFSVIIFQNRFCGEIVKIVFFFSLDLLYFVVTDQDRKKFSQKSQNIVKKRNLSFSNFSKNFKIFSFFVNMNFFVLLVGYEVGCS